MKGGVKDGQQLPTTTGKVLESLVGAIKHYPLVAANMHLLYFEIYKRDL